MRIIDCMRVLAALLTALVLVGCAATPPGAPSPTPANEQTAQPTPDAEAELERVMELRMGWGLEANRAWVERVQADPGSLMSPLGIPVTRDELAELERMIAQDPTTALIMYGARNWQQFGGLWVNEPGVGTVMLFTADLERHRQAIAAIAPNQRFEVRPARFTEHELRALQDTLVHELIALPGAQFLGLGLDVKNNSLHLELKSNDPTVKERLEAEHQGRLRVTVHPLPGPWSNREAGAGWRLLAAGIAPSEGYVVRAATDEGSWQALWRGLDPVAETPLVDLTTEVVVSFGHGIGSSCQEVRLDDVVIDHASGVVFSVTSDPLAPRACTADLVGGAYFVVALAREALPSSPFTVQLVERLFCESCDDQVTIDLP